MLNIIIRTSRNPRQFKRCMDSIESQTYKDLKTIVIVDDEQSIKYASKHNGETVYVDRQTVINETRNYKIPINHRYLPHNTYFNHIHDKLDGWVLVLDSDDLLSGPNILTELMAKIDEEDSDVMYFFNMRWMNKVIPGKMNNTCTPIMSTIGSPCFLWHTKYKEHFIWKPINCGDFFVMKDLHRAIPNHKFLDLVVANIVNVGSGRRRDNI